MKIKDNKVLINGMYTYKCTKCNKELNCYVEKKLNDKEIPTPFIDRCPYCFGNMQDISGMFDLPPYEFEIKEFNNEENSQGVYLLLDDDIKEYGDMVCGNLHINIKGNFVSVHDLKGCDIK